MKKVLAFVLMMVMCFSLVACSGGNGSSYSSSTRSSTTSSKSSSNNGYSSSSSSKLTNSSSSRNFTNKYGTATTKCAHSGCSNYIASSGDTNCCTTHSNKCLECKKYIDEDAMFCMSCITSAASKSSYSSSSKGSSSSYSSSSYSSSGEKCHYKEGGKEVCSSKCQSGSNFCSYHTKYLNDAYNSLFGN